MKAQKTKVVIDHEPMFTQGRIKQMREGLRKNGVTQEDGQRIVANLRRAMIRRGVLESQVIRIDSLGGSHE